MKKYKPVYEKDIALFLALYQKVMTETIAALPTDVIEYVFNGAKLVDDRVDLSRLGEAQFGVGGMCGRDKIRDLAWDLLYRSDEQRAGILVRALDRVGHKVDLKKVGPRKEN